MSTEGPTEGFDFRQWLETHPEPASKMSEIDWDDEREMMAAALKTRSSGTLPQVLTVEDIAEYLRVQEKTVRSYLREGRIPALQVGGRWRVEREAFRRWLVQEQTRAVQAPEVEEPKTKTKPVSKPRRRGDGSGPRF